MHTRGRGGERKGQGGHRQFCLPKFAHVGLSRGPQVRQKKPLDLTHLRFESRSRTTRSRFLESFALPVELQSHHSTTQHNSTPDTTQHNTTQLNSCDDTAQHTATQHSTPHTHTTSHGDRETVKEDRERERKENERQDKTRQDCRQLATFKEMHCHSCRLPAFVSNFSPL